MFKVAALTVQKQHDVTERVKGDSTNRRTPPTPTPTQASHEMSLQAQLKFYSTMSRINKLAFLEKIHASSVTKTSKTVIV